MFIAYLIIVALFIWITLHNSDINNLKNENSSLKSKISSLIKKVEKLDSQITKLCESAKCTNQEENETQLENAISQPIQENIEIKENTVIQETEIKKEAFDLSEFIKEQEDNVTVKEYSENDTIVKTEKIKTPVDNDTFESIFMGNVFNKIGAIAILIAICILVKLISSYIEFTDGIKTFLGFTSGIGMILAALKIQTEEKLKTFAEVLMGTGFGAILITIYCAASLMHIFSTQLATVLAFLVVIVTYFVADRQKTVSMLIIGLIGGYLNPFFVNTNVDTNFLFYSLIFLNLITLVFTYRNKNREWVNILNLIATIITVSAFSQMAEDEFSLASILILWSIYIIYDILYILTTEKGSLFVKTQSYVNFFALAYLSIAHFKEDFTPIGIILIFASIIYFLIGIYRFNKKDIENNFLYSGVISIFLATFFISQDFIRIIFWSFESSLVLYFATYYKQKNIAKLSYIFLCASIFFIFINKKMYDLSLTPMFNERALYFIPVIISSFVNSLIHKLNNSLDLSKVYKFIGITLIYTLFTIETNALITVQKYNDMFINYISYSIIGFIYSINIHYFSSSKNDGYYSVSKLLLYTSIIMLLVCDFCYTNFNNLSLIPIFNIRALAYSLGFLGLSVKLKKENVDSLKYVCVILGFAYVHFESMNIVQAFNQEDLKWFVSLMWILYAGIISVKGILNKKTYLKNSGIWISILAILRIFMYDLSELDMLFKLIAFIVLGVVLMIISYIYNKHEK